MLISLFTFGNLSRGDDAAGDHMHRWLSDQVVDSNSCWGGLQLRLINAYQLEPEHIFDLDTCTHGIFIDCHCNTQENFVWQPVQPGNQLMFSSHSMSIESLLYLYEATFKHPAPPCQLLGIAGYDFELGNKPSEKLLENVRLAQHFLLNQLANMQITNAI